MEIRKATKADHEAIWGIAEKVIATCESLVFAPDTSRERMLAFWCNRKKHVFVATLEEQVVGTFFISDNQPGLGAHVANAGYMTDPAFEGKGIGTAMGKYSLEEARNMGYKSMQFNIVLKSNEHAVKLWQRLGFEIVGEVPEVFAHPTKGLINSYVMWQRL
ncbi:GNAT family N-acetyltransferase [Roseivirga misakiensis]|uniref:GNAT family N-acetyltransferase n=1 Tax=Roseivirga misakiensis TaxID=1563681 RepID=A0A1E5SL00_9BACT|nr:N-acetyltransferase [Roseivirga misakiensis]OEJ99800.1 GNAT family N-acetyltransferase [Roseivirga misakiensis]